MEQLIKNINIRVFEKKRINEINQVFKKLLPLDFKKEKIIIYKEIVEGLENEIYVVSLRIKKQKYIKQMISSLFNKINENDLNIIYDQRESRLDDKGNFYIRLDKDLIFENKFVLTETGNCFHFKIKIAAFPANKKNFLKSIDKIFNKS